MRASVIRKENIERRLGGHETLWAMVAGVALALPFVLYGICY